MRKSAAASKVASDISRFFIRKWSGGLVRVTRCLNLLNQNESSLMWFVTVWMKTHHDSSRTKLMLKEHYVVLGWSYYFFFFMPEQTKQTNSLCFHDWINKLTLKDNTILYSFIYTLFICGGPCHLSSFIECSGDLIFHWEQLVYSVLEKSLYYSLINIVNI